MKRIVLLVFLFWGITSLSIIKAQHARIGVISDLHYTHPSLIVEKGAALDVYLKKDRKLLLESDALLKKSVQNLLDAEVNVVLIPGDLTKDGELVSHQAVAELLQPLREKGVKILVVPGNHDINNPSAVSFHGDETQRAETITPAQFKEIYDDYGFADAISYDEHSLSYVNEPVDGLRVLCIDACKYYDNTFVSRGAKKDSCVTHGAIKPETMRWIKTEIQLAKMLGKQVVAMMHHGVVEHFNNQSFFASPYLVDDFEWVQQSFMEAGLNVVFTGHFHASDIAEARDDKGNYLYDIETGSIVTYPCPYRIIDYADNNLDIKTARIEEIDYAFSNTDMSFQMYAQKTVKLGFDDMISGLIHDFHPLLSSYLPKWLRPIVRFPDAETFSDIVLSNFSPSALNMLIAHYGGNENETDNALQNKEDLLRSIDNFVYDLCQESLSPFSAVIAQKIILRNATIKKAKLAVSSIWENTILADNGNEVIHPYTNDWSCLLTLKVDEDINNGNFYADEHVDEKKIKAKLFIPHSEHKEEPITQPNNKFAVIERRKTLVPE